MIPFLPTNSPQLHNINENSITSYISTAFPQIRFNTSSSSTTLPLSTKPTKSKNAINHTVPDGFLVWSPSCQMLAMEPLAKDVMKLFRRGKN